MLWKDDRAVKWKVWIPLLNVKKLFLSCTIVCVKYNRIFWFVIEKVYFGKKAPTWLILVFTYIPSFLISLVTNLTIGSANDPMDLPCPLPVASTYRIHNTYRMKIFLSFSFGTRRQADVAATTAILMRIVNRKKKNQPEGLRGTRWRRWRKGGLTYTYKYTKLYIYVNWP